MGKKKNKIKRRENQFLISKTKILNEKGEHISKRNLKPSSSKRSHKYNWVVSTYCERRHKKEIKTKNKTYIVLSFLTLMLNKDNLLLNYYLKIIIII